MTILLTGGTGYIGSAVLRELLAAGHEVTALVRSEASAAKVEKDGATPLQIDLLDAAGLASAFAAADAVVHTAAGGDGLDQQRNETLVAVAKQVFGGTPTPVIVTGGVWVYGSGTDLTEERPFNPPDLTAWRVPVEQDLLAAGLAAAVVAPGIVYGHGGGIPRLVADGPRDDAGRLTLVGPGTQHWTTVHVDDVARLYVTVLDALRSGQRPGIVLGVGGQNPTLRELGEAAAGDAGVVPEDEDATRSRFGEGFGHALLLDQQATGAKARSLGWTPTAAPLVEELAAGY